MLGRRCRGGEGPLLPPIVGMRRSRGLPRHRIGLEINCGACSRSGLFQFRQTPAGVARLVCRHCDTLVSARGFRRRIQTDLLRVASLISDAIGKGEPELERIAVACRFLWSRPPDGTPCFTLVDHTLPFSQRPSFTAGTAPLTTLPPAWRAVTITVISDLLFQETAKKALLSASVREAFRQFERGSVPEYHPVPPPTRAASVLNLRPETEYRQLARGIIQSEGWKSLPTNAGRARNRAIGKLMRCALNGG